ncbi:MAG: S-layer homology domain-containing protein, partial [Eubacteriales bacterium]|nr:S-layer homology domain-containing protein [Eubacteriales bacterium]
NIEVSSSVDKETTVLVEFETNMQHNYVEDNDITINNAPQEITISSAKVKNVSATTPNLLKFTFSVELTVTANAPMENQEVSLDFFFPNGKVNEDYTETVKFNFNISPAVANDDIINAGGYSFKVLDITDKKIALIGKTTTRTEHNGTLNNNTTNEEYIDSITVNGDTYEVTQIGNGTDALTGSISTEDINKFGNTVTKIEANALKDVALNTTNSKTIKLNKVTDIAENALAFTTSDTVSLYLEGIQDKDKFDANAFGTSSAKVTLNLNSTVSDDISQNLASNANITVVKATDEIKINDITIDGKKNSKIQDKDIVITLGNSTLFEELKKAKAIDDTVTEAINVPNGLTAKIKSFDDTNNTVTITISGTPTVTSSVAIEIDGTKLGLTSTNNFVKNEKAKFNITESQTSGSPAGGSSGGGGAIVNSAGQTTQTTVEGQTEATTSQLTTSQIVTKNLSLDKVKLPTISDAVKSFTDIPTTHWASESISRLSSAGIINGMPNGSFNANGNTKRADVAVMLVRLLGINETFNGNFIDIEPNAYYANAVGIAREYGIVTGGTDGKFNPNANISRQDTMVMIARILDNLQITTNSETSNLQQFSDASNISGYAVDAVSKLVSAGIINGNNGKINPQAPIIRAEMAVIMDRLYLIIDKSIKTNATTETTIETTTSKDSSTETTTSKDGSTETTTKEGTTETTSETKTETTSETTTK